MRLHGLAVHILLTAAYLRGNIDLLNYLLAHVHLRTVITQLRYFPVMELRVLLDCGNMLLLLGTDAYSLLRWIISHVHFLLLCNQVGFLADLVRSILGCLSLR